MSKKKVVVIGGGNGSAISISALKQFKDEKDGVEISAIVSMSDSGGSSGRLRKEFDTLPPGDIMRAVLAMSRYDYDMLKMIFHRKRFTGAGKLDEHNLGNLFLALAERYAGDYLQAVRVLEQAVGAVGTVYPVTLDKTDLAVELTNGAVVRGEAEIDRPDYSRAFKIKKAWLDPSAKIFNEAKRVIEEADDIILGPGSLYTSVIAALLPDGVKEAIANSSAKLIYIFGGAHETNGETGPDAASGFFVQLENYLPRRLDLIVRNNHAVTEKERMVYIRKNWETVVFDKENMDGYNIVSADFEKEVGGLEAKKLGKILKKAVNNL
ncbi:MAG: uridine diphosphate-N-acetylglucosamine-binding protein YvcK [Patescibacteria group bacterium]